MLGSTLAKREIVLLGIGHTNAHVVRMWRMSPVADARLTCISNAPRVTYSGMLPGVLAGLYPSERMEIDLVRLCASAGARLIIGDVTGLEREAQRVVLRGRPPVPYDVLSIGIGSVPNAAGIEVTGENCLPIKPMQTFVPRLQAQLRRLAAQSPARLRLAIVGGGVGGVEITFCVPATLRKFVPGATWQITLVSRDSELAPGVAKSTRQRIERELERREVECLTGRRVVRVADGRLHFDDGQTLEADLVLWSTGAAPPPLLRELDLPRDERGFLLTRPTLQSTADDRVLVVGDSGTIETERWVPKAGVYAVRQGPVLWENLQRSLSGQPLAAYRPQRRFLKLLNLGDGRALAEYGALSLAGKWCWRLKDRIDGRFMDMYQNYGPMAASPEPDSLGPAMRCAGCGGKIGGSILSRVLERLEIPAHPQVLLGLDRPDDAAVIQPLGQRPLSLTVDFFAAPLDDAYLTGRIAALNSASDSFAVGGAPIAALASATIPVGAPRRQEELLYELLAGGLEEFRRMGATLIGGHTIEGPQLTIGYTMIADQPDSQLLTKALLRVGDRLALTKPLGSGVLLAAHMRAACRSEWYTELLDWMLRSNQGAAQLARGAGVEAMTDVTGFGLAGHLLEMLAASRVSARIQLDQIPLLPGTAELLAAGIESTLAPHNRAAEARIELPESQRRQPAYAALFDPQTSGGLLLSVRPERQATLETAWRAQFASEIAWLGEVIPAPAQPTLFVE